MQMAFGGEAIPLTIFNGAEVKKNEYRLCFSHNSANFSQSNISPIGVPHIAKRKSCCH
jgi:hypothetical protein